MQHITVGRKYNEGKVAKIECVRNDRLQNIDIKDKCFLLIILTGISGGKRAVLRRDADVYLL